MRRTLLVVPLACFALSAAADVVVREDAASGVTYLWSGQLIPESGTIGLRLGAARSRSGAQWEMSVSLTARSLRGMLDCERAQWLLDGVSIAMPTPRLSSQSYGDEVVESLYQDLDFAALKQFAAAKRVEFRTCGMYESLLSDDQLADFREFAAKAPLLKDGKLSDPSMTKAR